jgi:hypothetical protein
MADTLNEVTNQDVTTSVKKVRRLPLSEEDIKNLAIRVKDKWKSDGMKLKWKNPNQFELEVTQLAKLLEERSEKSDKRKPASLELSKLDKEIDKNIEYVKNYIKDKFGIEDSKTYYAQFGIESTKAASYKLLSDRDGRIKSLKKLVKALTDYEMTTQKFGKPYWEQILLTYEPLVNKTIQTDAEITEKVKDKNKILEEVRKTLSSLMKLIEAHHPDDYEAVWREWGFQKGKY